MNSLRLMTTVLTVSVLILLPFSALIDAKTLTMSATKDCKKLSKRLGKTAFKKRFDRKSYNKAFRKCVLKNSKPRGDIKSKITLTVPFSFTDRPEGVIPMGETIYHPKPRTPNGHPGIDYQWLHGQRPMMLASVDGVVRYINKPDDGFGTYSVVVRSGKYQVGYRELESFNSNLSIGGKIKRGDFIGYPWSPTFNGNNDPNYHMIHWDFGYDMGTEYQDILCPMTYFDAASKLLTQEVNDSSTWEFKNLFPYVCSGDFFGKDR